MASDVDDIREDDLEVYGKSSNPYTSSKLASYSFEVRITRKPCEQHMKVVLS